MSDDLNKDKESGFGMPSDYFGRSAQSLVQRLQWIEELRDFPHLSELKKNEVFSIPENYFDSGAVRLELLDYPSLKNVSKKEAFITPEDYFETTRLNSHVNIHAGIGAVKKDTADLFNVPSSYFEKSAASIFNVLISKKRGGRIISLRRGMKYSMAAMLLIVLSIWIYNLYFAKALVEDCGTMACVDRQDVVASKNIENLENDELYELVNTAKLKENLEKEGAATTPPHTDSVENEMLDEVYDDI